MTFRDCRKHPDPEIPETHFLQVWSFPMMFSKMTDLRQVRDESLTSRQQAFLHTMRKHDHHAVVLRDNGRLIFKGPVIGTGPMPGDEPDREATPARPPSAAVQFRGQDWTAVKRRLSNHYAQLTEEDLTYIPGEEDALIGRIERRTMENREDLERVLREECGCGTAPRTH
jgi:hypothetical protein